jgi:hypothetical protein
MRRQPVRVKMLTDSDAKGEGMPVYGHAEKVH